MKKLKNKVFFVISLILTLFLISILIIFNCQDYKQESESIKGNLFRLDESHNKEIPDNIQQPKLDKIPEMPEKSNTVEPTKNIDDTNNQKFFMDLTVYTVILDSNNNIKDVINHTENEINNSEIIELAQNILNTKGNKNIKIGNLYFEKYSYLFQDKNSLIIIDNATVQEKLLNTLKTSIIIFIFLELVIIYVSIKLTSWIIKPVIESFNKQKQFIADASHELKTPLAVIIASTEALESDRQETKWLDNIKSESERMNNLITNLLELAKSENGLNKQTFSEVDLSKLIEKCVLTFEGLIYEKNIKLEYNIEKNIKYKCCSEQMKQLISILLDNAIKHSDTENGKIEVNLKKDNKHNIVLEVKDKGDEIPKDKEEKIFERFYRVDESRNRNENRYGLGLAIAKNIVINHNGKISASSNTGITTFKVVFNN